MKKIVLLSLFALCLPLLVMAQSNNDDLYFVPSKEKKQEAKKTPVKKEPEKKSCYHEHLYVSGYYGSSSGP